MAETKYNFTKEEDVEDERNGFSVKASGSTKRPFTRLEKRLIALAVVLAICVLIFIILFAVFAFRTKPAPKENFKNTKAAVIAASELLRSLDTSVSPCDDFYQYSCGGWLERQTDSETVTQFSLLNNQVDRIVGRLLNSSESRREYAEHEAASKMLDYYDSCMDRKEIEKKRDVPLQRLITKYGSWPATNSSWNESTWEFLPNQRRLAKDLDLSTIFFFSVGQDLKNSSKNVIYVNLRGTGLARSRYFDNLTRDKEILKAYKRYIGKVGQLLGASKNQSDELVEDVCEFEKQLYKMSTKLEKGENLLMLLKKMTIREFTSLTNSLIDWKQYINEQFSVAGLQVTDDYEIHVLDVPFFGNLTKLMKTTPKRVLANHFIWHMVMPMVDYLSSEFRGAYKEYLKTFLDKSNPRWKECVYEVDKTFGMVLGLVFVEEVLQKDGKQEALDLVDSLRIEFEDSFDDIEWMDKNTTEAAKKKTRVMAEHVGYPEYIKNTTYINQEYKQVYLSNPRPTSVMLSLYKQLKVNKQTYFENVLQDMKTSLRKRREELTKPVDKKQWTRMPQTINAFYWPPDNKIVVPAGILQPPFFASGRPRSMNYGSIGMIIGHEISHGFDTQGRLFNWDGNMVEWWTAASVRAFKNKTKCFVDQYSNITVDGLKIDGKVTLSENMADNGGLKHSYKAFKIAEERLGEEPPLPGNLGFTHDQLFFLSFAQTFCTKYTAKSIKRRLSGPHSPGRGRVIGSVSNMPEFAAAFNCRLGSKMNPKKKCSMW